MSGEAQMAVRPMGLDRVGRLSGTDAAGSCIVAVSAVAFSTAGLFTRLIAVDSWTMLFWRGLFGGLLIAAWIVWRQRSGTMAAFAAIGRAGLVVAGCSTVATICFITALRRTSVADVTILYATAPFLAAVLAWIGTGARPTKATLAASGLALAGVMAMCGGALTGGALASGALASGALASGAGAITGDLLALAMAALMALMMVVIRAKRRVSMLPAACLSAFACALAVLPMAHPAAVTGGDLAMLALFGTSQFGLGLLLLTVGSGMIAAPRASLLANLELPFAPLWVWLAFGEVPATATWIGGGVVCVAVVWDLMAARSVARG